MARKEAINSFTDGLNTDLSPLNTPNTILTDCLNGTLITYDGNELTLQNDKGNYPLKDCKLPENYIPVGVKEYGDIIYIVSYNPLDKHVEIGSYPSPRIKLNANNDPVSEDKSPLTREVFSYWNWPFTNPSLNPTTDSNDPTYSYIEYSKIVERSDVGLQLFYGGSEEDYKIYPGDEYKISYTEVSNNFEDVGFYIIDPDKKLHDITSEILEKLNNTDFKFVNWNIPGWLCIKSRIGEISDFKVNVHPIKIPNYTSSDQTIENLTLDLQMFIDDPLIYNNIYDTSCLKVDVTVSISDTLARNHQTITLNSKRDLKNGSWVYYNTYTLPTNTLAITSNSIINVIVQPRLYHPVDRKYIVFDKYEKEYSFNVSQKGNVNDLELGAGVFQYTVDDDKLYITFDTNGVEEGAIINDEICLKYSLRLGYDGRALPEFVVKDDTENPIEYYENIIISDWSVIGNTTIELDLAPYSTSSYSSYPKRLYPENLYIIEFNFYNSSSNNGTLLKGPIRKFIVASKLMNSIKANRFDTVYFDDWMDNYSNNIINKSIYSATTLSTIESGTPVIKPSSGYDYWMKDCNIKGGNNSYSTFIKYTDYEDTLSDGFTITYDAICPVVVDFGSNIKLPAGPLWENFNTNCRIVFKIDKDEFVATINASTGESTVTQSSYLTTTVRKPASVGNKYTFVKQTASNMLLWSYQILNLDKEQVRLSAEGLYNSMSSDPGHDEPDIRTWTSLSSGKSTYKNHNTSYKNFPEFIKELEKHDVLLVKLVMEPQTLEGGTAHYNKLRFRTESQSGNYYAEATVDSGSETYYAVFLIGSYSADYRLGFIKINELSEISAASKLDLLLNKIEHIKCEHETAISGGFFTVDLNNIIPYTTNSINVNVSGLLKPTSYMYKDHYFCNWNSRSHIHATLVNIGVETNNLKGKNSDNYKLHDFLLDPSNHELLVDLTRSQDFNTAVASYETQISNRNIAIEQQIGNYSSDPIYNDSSYQSDSDIYKIKANTIYTSEDLSIVNILNTKYMEYNNVYFEAEDKGDSVFDDTLYHKRVRVGVTDETITI